MKKIGVVSNCKLTTRTKRCLNGYSIASNIVTHPNSQPIEPFIYRPEISIKRNLDMVKTEFNSTFQAKPNMRST